MLLGMNAHISHDLPFALASIRRASGGAQADFDLVNGLLERVQGPMLTEAAARFDPTIDDFTLRTLDVDDQTVSQLIAAWRTEAWLNSERLLAATTAEEQAAVEAHIERRASARALVIRAATAYLPVLTRTDTRDAYCDQKRNS
jgi:hypothetical protein